MDFSLIFGYPLGWVMWALYQVVKNYGIAILIFTLFIRVILYPLGIKQQKSTARMAMFQPKIADLQKKYKNNKQKLQEEQMKLYEKEGYNPMSGCFPMLIQLPILFGLINVIYNPLTHMVRISDALIKQATDIAHTVLGNAFIASSPQISIINAVKVNPTQFSSLGSDFVNSVQNFDLTFLGFNLGETPVFGWNWLILLPLISGATSVFAMWLSTKYNYSAAMGGQQMAGATKGMLFIMPLFSLFFAFSVPSGVVLYWIASNVFMAIQTIMLYRIYSPEKMKVILEKDRVKQQAKKKQKSSKLQRMLQESQMGKQEVEKAAAEDESAIKEYQGEMLTQKEIDRRRLAEARRRDAEKYGEDYKEVTDDDLR